MADTSIQDQMEQINRKLDMVLEEVNKQRMKREEMEDLVKDMSLIGKDVFNNSVQTLDKAGVELDYEALNSLIIRFVRNISTFNQLFEMLESAMDLMKDLRPIINQVGMDAIQRFSELEELGYIDFFKEIKGVTDNVVKHFSPQDVRLLADNIVTILETIRNMTQPDVLLAMNNAVTVFKSMDTNEIKEYSLFGALKELNSKEMRKGIGFMISFLKKLSKSFNKTSKN